VRFGEVVAWFRMRFVEVVALLSMRFGELVARLSVRAGEMQLGSERNFVLAWCRAGCKAFPNFDLTPNAALLDCNLVPSLTINCIAA
jgi:hypothetical protein